MPQDNRGFSTGPSSGVDINIGATPGMSPNARAVLQQIMAKPSDNWGSAVSRLGAAFALGHAEKKARTVKEKKTTETQENRQRWAESLGAGMTPRDLAVSDPDFLADTDFQQQWAGTAAPPEAATWEDVDSPYGRGGFGQRNSITGEIKGYQGPVAPPPEVERWDDVASPFGQGGFGQRNSVTGQISGYNRPVVPTVKQPRRIVEGADGKKYYADDESRVLPNVEAALPETADTSVSMPDQLKMVRQLSDDWQKTVRPMQGLLDQSERMSIGLRMAQRGDLLAGSQAILISFNKLLDPTSVVRESEYARSATGQSAIETLKGYADKLKKGGAGVVLGELKTYKQFGEKDVQKALESTVGPERKRISRLVDFAGVDPDLVFTGRFASNAEPKGTPQGMPPMVQGSPLALGNAPDAAGRGLAAVATALTGGQPPLAPSPSPLPVAQGMPPMAQGDPNGASGGPGGDPDRRRTTTGGTTVGTTRTAPDGTGRPTGTTGRHGCRRTGTSGDIGKDPDRRAATSGRASTGGTSRATVATTGATTVPNANRIATVATGGRAADARLA